MNDQHIGPSFDDFLNEEEMLEVCTSIALARVRTGHEVHGENAQEYPEEE